MATYKSKYTGPQIDEILSRQNFAVLGLYPTLADLQAAHPTSNAGDAYAVGDETNNTVYIWDADLLQWVNIGNLKGDDGVGVPIGGTTGQILTKQSANDYDTDWIDQINVINNLTTDVIGSALDATQGKILNDKISTSNLIFVDKTVLATDFIADATYADYSYKADIACTGVTTDYFGDVTFGVDDAISGNYAPVCLTSADTVTIYAVTIPSSNISIPSIKLTKAVI